MNQLLNQEEIELKDQLILKWFLNHVLKWLIMNQIVKLKMKALGF